MKAAKPRRSSAASAAPGTALLAEATRVLGGTLDLGRLMRRLSELAATRLTADAAGVWLFERRQALTEMLVSQGHAVVGASSGPAALRILGEDAGIDFVITDLVMPTMTGWELADAVKASRPALPIGVVSGWGDVAEAAPGTQAAVDFVLSKPLTLEALAGALGRLGKR